MLKIGRRHQPPCKRKMYDFGYTKCKCPVLIRGTLNGNRITQSTARFLRSPLDRDLDAANQLARHWEAAGEVVPIAEVAQSGTPAKEEEGPAPATVEEAVAAYLSNAKGRGTSEGTRIKKESWYARRTKLDPRDRTTRLPAESSSLLAFCDRKGIRFLYELTLPVMEDFRTSWNVGDLVRHKRQCSLIGFFWFCEKRGWFPRNYATDITTGLGKIEVKETETDYFPPEEYTALLDATYLYSDRPSVDRHNGPAITDGGRRIRTIMELMRWSGLRIRDAATLERRKLIFDKFRNRWRIVTPQKKTGKIVYCPLPPHVAELLNSIPASQKGNTNDKYFFWTGNGKHKTIVSNWERSFAKLFELAGLQKDGQPKRCHPHMFRDTFAIEALVSGMPVQQVSEILGHSSIAITEKHYLGWVIARQGKLDDAAEASWLAQGIGIEPKRGPGRPRVIQMKEKSA